MTHDWPAAAARERLDRWLADRGGQGALDALADVAALRRFLDQAELAAVRAARAAGSSWAEVATMLGITRQSAWEKWRDLDDSPGEREELGGVHEYVGNVLGRAVGIGRRRGNVRVPVVIGLSWKEARWLLHRTGLVERVDGAAADVALDAVVVDQNPESGARVPAGSGVRLWFDRGGGGGVREPRRPVPEPRSGRAMREQFSDETSG